MEGRSEWWPNRWRELDNIISILVHDAVEAGGGGKMLPSPAARVGARPRVGAELPTQGWTPKR